MKRCQFQLAREKWIIQRIMLEQLGSPVENLVGFLPHTFLPKLILDEGNLKHENETIKVH